MEAGVPPTQPEGDDNAPLNPEDALWAQALYRPLTAAEQDSLVRSAPTRLRVLAALAQLKAQRQWAAGRPAAQAQWARLLQSEAPARSSPQSAWAWLRHLVQDHVGPVLSLLVLQGAAVAWLLSVGLTPPTALVEAPVGPQWRGGTDATQPLGMACPPWRVQWRRDLTMAQLDRALQQWQLQVRSGPDEAGRYTLAGPSATDELIASLQPLATLVEANPACALTPPPQPAQEPHRP